MTFTIKQGVIDPFFTNNLLPAYLLLSDGTNSKVKHNPNIAAPGANATWQDGEQTDGDYSVMRATNVAGTVMIKGHGSSTATTYSDNLQTALGSKSHVLPYGPSLAYWSATIGGSYSATGGRGGGGCIAGANTGVSAAPPNPKWNAVLVVDLGSQYTVTAAEFWGYSDIGAAAVIRFYDSAGSQVISQVVDPGGSPPASTYSHQAWTGTAPGCRYIMFVMDNGGATVDLRIDDISVTYNLPSSGEVVATSTDYGATISVIQTLGTTVPTALGFDVQRSGGNSFAAADSIIARATTLGGAYSTYYSPTGGAQAVCVIVPYSTYSGALNTSNTNPDILVALDTLDGSSRSLLWIEGGATPGTIHDITPTAGVIFDNPNCLTILTNNRLAVFGKVSGVYHLYTSINKGVSWTDRGVLISPHFIRDRRNDSRVSPNGQLFLASNSELAYSSKWASGGGSIAGLFPRIPPFVPTGIDPIF